MDQDQGDLLQDKDPTRLCPVCRMPISILAIRCRFCGTEVGRPRKEQETFTVKDLGGEQRSTYTLSGNVTEALEAFLSEERAHIESKERERQAAANKSLFRRMTNASSHTTSAANSTGLPDLDAVGRDLTESSTSSTRSKSMRTAEQVRLEALQQKILIAAAITAGVILLFVGAGLSWGRIQNFMNPQTMESEFIYPNRAEDFLAAGTPLVEVLEEALAALRYNDTDENRRIAETMRARFVADIEGKAFSNPFSMEKLSGASRDIIRAASTDPDPRIGSLREEITREVSFFKFILTHVDEDAKTASFRLNNPFVAEKDATVSVGDILQDRFLVTSIKPREVVLEDIGTRATGRLLVARRMEPVAPIQ